MRLALLLALAVLLLLLLAPAAGAVEYEVDLASDTSTPEAFACTGADPDDCPLRSAIALSNSTTVTTDVVSFEGGLTNVNVSETTVVVTDPLTLADAEGDVTINWTNPTDPGPMLLLAAPDATTDGAGGSDVRRLDFQGMGGAGALVRVEAAHPVADTILDQLGFTGSVGNALEIGGVARGINVVQPAVTTAGASGVRVEDSAQDVTVSGGSIQGATAPGVSIAGIAQRVTLSGLSITANADDGLEVSGSASGVTFTSGLSTGNQGYGVHVNGAQRVQISRTPIYANDLGPIRLDGGANAGITPPAGVRVGPRQADGTLPISGTTTVPGTVEVFSGDPFGSGPISYFASFSAPGGFFSYVPAPEPSPGTRFALTLTDSAGDTSEFSDVAVVPDDVFSPFLLGGVAVSTTEVRVQPSEPLDPASLQPSDFVLEMAGSVRTVTRVAAAPDGSSFTLSSSGWKAGEAGFVTLSGPGAVTDAAGNASLAVARVRVAAAPGDFIPPFISSLSIRPRTICLTKGRGCRKTGGVVSFITSEQGRGRWRILRGNKALGERIFRTDAGRNRVRLDGRVRGRKLRAGRYRLLVYSRDDVGNESYEPGIALFSVKRVKK